MSSTDPIADFLTGCHPFDALDAATRAAAVADTTVRRFEAGARVYRAGEAMPGLLIVAEGGIDITAPEGDVVGHLAPGDVFGAQALLRDGIAAYTATCATGVVLYVLSADGFRRLMKTAPAFAQFFDRSAAPTLKAEGPGTLATLRVAEMMTADPVFVSPSVPVTQAATVMRRHRISCVLVAEHGRLKGILTTGDITGRVVAAGRGGDTAVAQVMTPAPRVLAPDAIGMEAFLAMIELGVGHIPVTDDGRSDGRPVGILTRTNLVYRQSVSSALMVGEIKRAEDTDALAAVVARNPQLLSQMVGAGAEAHVIARMITDVTDAVTRRLLVLAEARFGPPPVPYLWLACGSQGRREQTGVSDQDNCLILDEAATPEHDAYFADLARYVTDGLDACGYIYCPGEMMATNPKWRQPLNVWRDYFVGWIQKPDPMAQMLASVMFDLRPIAGAESLFTGLQEETLRAARANSIFVAHMTANSLKHQPPLGMFRGFAVIRKGEHKDTVDLKHAGVVPVVDLARLYALQGELKPVNTRARLAAAREAGVISLSGGRDLLDAFDLIAETRIRHQSRQIRQGQKPDNYMAPSSLSELERNHLRDAFLIIKTMQSAAGQGKYTVS